MTGAGEYGLRHTRNRRLVAADTIHDLEKSRPWRAIDGDQSACAFERARYEFASEQAFALKRAGHVKRAGTRRREAKAAVIVGVTDQKNGAVLPRRRLTQGVMHQGAANPAVLRVGCDSKRTKQQARPVVPGGDRPQPDGADQAPAIRG